MKYILLTKSIKLNYITKLEHGEKIIFLYPRLNFVTLLFHLCLWSLKVALSLW